MSAPVPPGTLHPDLRRRFGCTLVGAVVLFGLPGLALLVGLLWLPRKTDRDLMAIAAASVPALILLVSAWTFGLAAFWYRRCSDVLHGRPAASMRLRTIRNDKGGLFLELHRLGDLRMREPELRIQAEVPSWDTGGLDGAVVKVRAEDDTSGVVVVETERGILWPAAFARRVNRPRGDKLL